MSSPFRASLLVLGAAAVALAACDREEHHSRAKPIGETVPAGQSPDTIWPGGTAPPALDARARLYDNNASAIADGQTSTPPLGRVRSERELAIDIHWCS